MTNKRRVTEVEVNPAGDDHQVVTVVSGEAVLYRREPCGECPWRRDQAGSFPPEAFAISAKTASDCSDHTFACHMSGTEKPAICAGFLLRGSDHNLAVQMRVIAGEIDLESVKDGGHRLFDGYREMAVENGVGPDDPAMKVVR